MKGSVKVIEKISKRKLESYKRAEVLAREIRFQMASTENVNNSLLIDLVIHWMKATGNIKYKRPSEKGC